MTESVVSVKMPRALALQIDARTRNRSDFLRQAAVEKIERDKKQRKGGSVLDRVRSGNCPGGLKRVPLNDLAKPIQL